MPNLTGVMPGWAPVDKATVLDGEAAWVPDDWKAIGTEMAAAPLWDPDTAVIVGRPGGPAMRDSEVARLAHLAGLTSVVTGRSPLAVLSGLTVAGSHAAVPPHGSPAGSPQSAQTGPPGRTRPPSR